MKRRVGHITHLRKITKAAIANAVCELAICFFLKYSHLVGIQFLKKL